MRKITSIVAVLTGILLWTGAHAQILDIVRTESGLVSGDGTDIRAFRGIPYARPPVASLRWRPPQEAMAWQEVRDGTKFGPDCVQPPYYPELRGPGQSEDCLTLNVWTPARQSGAPLPVMVWIFGGGFTNGSGSHPTYDGTRFAQHGVVLVTLNYRLGLLGFMAHPALSAESPSRTSGNYALLDQIAALQWVKRNIAAFGGDPSRVTVFGQSAGAMSIEALITSPLAEGLFQQAILQSVGAMRPVAILAAAEAFGRTVGEDLTALRAMPAAELAQKIQAREGVFRDVTSPRPLGIIVDGSVIPTSDYVAFTSGRYAKIPMIVGSNLNEGGAFTRNSGIRTVTDFQAYFRRNFGPSAEQSLAAYSVRSDADVGPQLDRLLGDTEFNYGTRRMLRLAVRNQPHLWRYLFSRSRNGDEAAPVHGAELQYVFGTLDATHKGARRPFDAADSSISRAMMEAWVRFASTGDPNGVGLPQWPAYDPAKDNYLEFGEVIAARDGSPAPQLDFLESFYHRREP